MTTTHEYLDAVKENGTLKERVKELEAQFESFFRSRSAYEEKVFAGLGLPWPVHSRPPLEMLGDLWGQSLVKIADLTAENARLREALVDIGTLCKEHDLKGLCEMVNEALKEQS